MVWKLKHKPKVIEITTSINYEFNKRIKFNQFHQSDLKKRRFRCKTSKLSRAVYVIWQLDAYKHKSTRIKLTQSVAVRDCPCFLRVHKKKSPRTQRSFVLWQTLSIVLISTIFSIKSFKLQLFSLFVGELCFLNWHNIECIYFVTDLHKYQCQFSMKFESRQTVVAEWIKTAHQENGIKII